MTEEIMPGWSVTTDPETGNKTYTAPDRPPEPCRAPAVRLRELRTGRTYRVEFDDCCVKGSFTSQLVVKESHCGEPVELRWDNGVVLQEFERVEFWATDD